MARLTTSTKSDHPYSSTGDHTVSKGQCVDYAGKEFKIVKEGLAFIMVAPNSETTRQSQPNLDHSTISQSVFYNPIQQFNRDLSVLAIRAFGEDFLAVRGAKASQKNLQATKSNEHSKSRRKRKASDALDNPTDTMAAQNTSKNKRSLDATNAQVTEAASEGSVLKPFQESEFEPPPKVPQAQCAGKLSSSGRLQDMSIAESPNKPIGLKILDALSATGLRALRYAKEIPFVSTVTANDISAKATDMIKANVVNNCLEHVVRVVNSNAASYMYNLSNIAEKNALASGKYDVIDLDPYGTAVPFLDAAVQALNEGGLLCVTCTDAAVWASCGYPEKTFSLYGGNPIKGLHSHEGGLRLILHAIATTAARYGMSVEPLLSLSIDFYARVFVRVFKSPAEVKFLAGRTILVYNCDSGCGAWSIQPLGRNQRFTGRNETSYFKHSLPQGPTSTSHCEHCGLKTHVSGPMYGGALHNNDFLKKILSYVPELTESTYATKARIEGMITTAIEETIVDPIQNQKCDTRNTALSRQNRPVPRNDISRMDPNPFFFIPSALSKVLHCTAPSEAAIRGALIHAGYAVTRSHIKPGSVRTNAPWAFIWSIMREWVFQKAPVKDGSLKKDTAGWNILYSKSHVDYKEEAILNTRLGKEKDHSYKSSQLPIVFNESLGRKDNKQRLIRYQPNPYINWGPLNRAKA